MIKKICFILWLLHSVLIQAASIDAYQFTTAEQEEAFSNLTSELRCMVCQNQTISDSNADLAKDLRSQVYEMLQQGKTEQEIKQFMLTRYGDYVLYRPPFKLKTGLLWLGPLLFLLLGLFVAYLYIRRKKQQQDETLTTEQEQKIRQLLEKNGDEL